MESGGGAGSGGRYLFGVRCTQWSSGSVHVSDGSALLRLWIGGKRVPDLHGRKWFLEAVGHDGLNNLLAAYEDKRAEAICTFAYCAGPGSEPLIFEGRVLVGRGTLRCPASKTDSALQGKIVPARGPLGFGTLVRQDTDYLY